MYIYGSTFSFRLKDFVCFCISEDIRVRIDNMDKNVFLGSKHKIRFLIDPSKFCFHDIFSIQRGLA